MTVLYTHNAIIHKGFFVYSSRELYDPQTKNRAQISAVLTVALRIEVLSVGDEVTIEDVNYRVIGSGEHETAPCFVKYYLVRQERGPRGY